ALHGLRAVQVLDEVDDVLAQTLVLVRHGEPRACGMQLLGNGPGDAAVVRHAEHNGALPRQVDGNGHGSPPNGCCGSRTLGLRPRGPLWVERPGRYRASSAILSRMQRARPSGGPSRTTG